LARFWRAFGISGGDLNTSKPPVRHWFTPQRVALKIIKSSKNVRQPLNTLHVTGLICQIMYWKRMVWIQTVKLKYSIYKTQTSLNAIMLFLLFFVFFHTYNKYADILSVQTKKHATDLTLIPWRHILHTGYNFKLYNFIRQIL